MNQYEVTKVLGGGSYGSVLRARNRNNGELVAIKKMKQKYTSWEECMKLREINSLRKLVHPNIVKLKEVIRENDELHLVFEFCEGNLYEHMKAQLNKGRSLPESKVCSFMFQTLQAVQHVHKHGYFHRDLKPDNLLVSGEVVKLADFGLAREIRTRPPFTDYVATRWYRAPEILLRSRCYNSPVDMWAVGAIMAELYTMRPLMPGTSEPDQLFKICSVLGTPTQAQWPDGHRLAEQMGFRFPQMAPTALEVLLPQGSAKGLCVTGRMLQWDPGQRPTACQALQHPFFEGCAPEASQQAQGGAAETSCRRTADPETAPAAPARRAYRQAQGGAAETSCQRTADLETAPAAPAPTRRLPRLPVRSGGSFGLGRGTRRAARGPGDPASARELGARRISTESQEPRMGGSCSGFFLGQGPASPPAAGGGGARAFSQTASGGFGLPALQRAAQGEKSANSPLDGESVSPSGACPRVARCRPGGAGQPLDRGSFSPSGACQRISRCPPGARQAAVTPAAVQSALSRWGR